MTDGGYNLIKRNRQSVPGTYNMLNEFFRFGFAFFESVSVWN